MIRGCGFQNECGAICFSVLAQQLPLPRGRCQEEIERLIEFYLIRAVLDLSEFSCAYMHQIHTGIYVTVSCRCVKYVMLRRCGLHLVCNCVVRLQSSIPISSEDKHDYLRYISRRLFNAPAPVVTSLASWMERRRKTDFQFVQTGLVLRIPACVRLALSTMSFEVSNSVVPRCVPFLTSPVTYLECCRVNVRVKMALKLKSYGSCVTQSLITRSMLLDFVPREYQEMVFRGVCYIPGHRCVTFSDLEEWTIHIHGPYCSCLDGCDRCSLKAPMNLYYLAQLACLKLAIERRRARVTHDRKSPFFK